MLPRITWNVHMSLTTLWFIPPGFNTVGGAKIPTKCAYFPPPLSVMRKKASPEICLTSRCVQLLMDSIKGAHLMLAEFQTALEKELFQVLRSLRREGRQEKCCETDSHFPPPRIHFRSSSLDATAECLVYKCPMPHCLLHSYVIGIQHHVVCRMLSVSVSNAMLPVGYVDAHCPRPCCLLTV